MKKCMTVLALLLCLCLSACGGEKQDSGGQASFLSRASGLEEETVLLTVDGREVPAWRYLYWLAYTCDQLREQYEISGVPLDWETPVSGETLAEYAKGQALADTVLYATVENWAEQYGCQLTDAEGAGVALPDMGLDPEQMDEIETVGRMYAWLYDLSCTGETALSPTQEELEAYAADCGVMTLDRIFIAAGEDRENARQRAAEMFSRLNSAEDQAAEFTALAAEGDDTAGPRTIWPENSSLDEELLEAARELEPYQCSGILETEEGFSILRRDETDPVLLKEDYFDHLLLAAAGSAAVTTMPEYEELNTAAFDAALEELRKTDSKT